MILYKELVAETIESKSEYEPATIQEAYMGLFYSILASDGKWTEKESRTLRSVIASMEEFDDENEVYYLEKIQRLSISHSLKSIVKGCITFIPQPKRPRLFCFCAELVIADRKVAEIERTILNYLAEHSGLSVDIANKIIDVSLIRLGMDDAR